MPYLTHTRGRCLVEFHKHASRRSPYSSPVQNHRTSSSHHLLGHPSRLFIKTQGNHTLFYLFNPPSDYPFSRNISSFLVCDGDVVMDGLMKNCLVPLLIPNFIDV